MIHRLALVATVGLGACIPPPPAAPQVEPAPPPPDWTEPPPPSVSWQRIAALDGIPREPPPPGTWRIHMIDVGTGLAILVQGYDFAMLYDAGTNDRQERPTRVLDYLAAALAIPRLDHVVLSHPHLDHASALEPVLTTHEVANFWDAGRINETVFYRELLEGLARETDATYHTAAPPAERATVHVKGFDVLIPNRWETFSEGDVVELGDDARFTLVHAEAKAPRDINANSIVVAVDLGETRLLLTGDAGSGKRADPGAPVGETEEYLIDHAAELIDADILQVGHHGSKTSSRRGFLDAVSPSLALVSTGPKAYSGTVLPDAEVIDALIEVGATVLRTDEHDADCAGGPGGCDSFIVTVEASPGLTGE